MKPIQLPPYYPDGPCAKCGAIDARTSYHQGGLDCLYSERKRDYPAEVGEHLHRRCQRCGYDWRDATVEALPTIEELAGSDPNFTGGGLSSEEYVRRMRGGGAP